MRGISMRFENSALKMFGIDSVDLDDLRGTGEAGDDSNRAHGDTGEFREETNDRLIRSAIHRRRGHVQFPGVSISTCKFGLAGAGAHLKRESGFHLSRC